MNNNSESKVSIRIPCPVVDSDDAEAMRVFGTSVVGQYDNDLERIQTELQGLGITMTQPIPQRVIKPEDKHFIVTVELIRNVTVDQIKTALAGFKVEECEA